MTEKNDKVSQNGPAECVEGNYKLTFSQGEMPQEVREALKRMQTGTSKKGTAWRAGNRGREGVYCHLRKPERHLSIHLETGGKAVVNGLDEAQKEQAEGYIEAHWEQFRNIYLAISTECAEMTDQEYRIAIGNCKFP